MTFKIIYVSTAAKELNRLPESDFKKVQIAINSLSDDPFPPGHIKLEGTKEKLFRIRRGNYRVVYSVRKNIITVTILKVGHRKDVYKS